MLQAGLLAIGLLCVLGAAGLGYRDGAAVERERAADRERIAVLVTAAAKAGLAEQARARVVVDLREHLRALLAAYERQAAASRLVVASPVVWPLVVAPVPFVAPGPLTRDPYVRMTALLREASACGRPE